MAIHETVANGLLSALETLKSGGANDFGVKLCERNRVNDISDDQRKSLVLIDGDNTSAVDLLLRNGRPAGGAKYTAEFDIWGEDEAPQATIGAALNDFVNAVIWVFANNAGLKTALGADGAIAMTGLTRNFYASAEVVGIFCMTISVTCTINPTTPAV